MGLVFGVKHALEPDHLAAVGTFVPKHATPRGAAYIGALWGAGHAAAVLVLGTVLLSLQLNLPEWVDSRLTFKGRIERDGWISQAKILAEGGSTEFSKKAKKGK